MASKFAASLSCIICNENWGPTSPRPHYPSMPKYPKGQSPGDEGPEKKVIFSVSGITCSACAGSVEKAVKRLPGIREAAVDVLNHRALVHYYSNFVTVSSTFFFLMVSSTYIHLKDEDFVFYLFF